MITMISNKKAIQYSIYISSLIFIFLVWYTYLKGTSVSAVNVSFLPVLNCIFNGFSALFLVLGVRAIFKKKELLHKRFMLSALIFSGLFLISYLTYHHFHGDSLFLGQGGIRIFYFFILISHIVLTIGVLPLILVTFFYALTQQFPLHKKIARWTFPLWMYVSVTGILIYLLQQI
jgi:putative membrane protein